MESFEKGGNTLVHGLNADRIYSALYGEKILPLQGCPLVFGCNVERLMTNPVVLYTAADDATKEIFEGSKALLDWQLEVLSAAGIEEIAIVTGYKRELLANRGLVNFHNERWAETNMVSSLACAQTWLEKEPCIVSYSDIYYNSSAVESLITCSSPLAVTYDPNWLELWTQRFGDPLLDAESFRLTPEHTLSEIGNKPKSVDQVQGQYMGLLRFTPEGWAEVIRIRSGLSSDQRDKMHMTGTLQRVIDAGCLAITAIPYSDKWGEFDSELDLVKFETLRKS